MTTAYIAARWTDFGQVGHHHARLSDAIERPNATWACPAHIAEYLRPLLDSRSAT